MLFVEINQKMKSIEKGKGLTNMVEIVNIATVSLDFKEDRINLILVKKVQ